MDLRANGPWDESEMSAAEQVERLDLGALLVAPMAGIDVQVQVDEGSGQVAQLTFARPDAAVQVQPSISPTRFSGASTSSQNCAVCSRMASTTSGVAS